MKFLVTIASAKSEITDILTDDVEELINMPHCYKVVADDSEEAGKKALATDKVQYLRKSYGERKVFMIL